MRSFFFGLLFLLMQVSYSQQRSPYAKFGNVGVEELKKKFYPIDSSASAVVLSDIGKAAIEGNRKGSFSLVITRHRVVHILNKNGYDEADVSISLYQKDDYEIKLDNLKAVTYNYEGGKIIKTSLDRSAVFKEKIDKNRSIAKFTFPNIKEGSIIEYEYTVISDYIHYVEPWSFQGFSPVLWSEFVLGVPQFFTYESTFQGYQDFYIKERKDRQKNFVITVDENSTSISHQARFTASVTDFRWVMKNVPELKEERYTSTLNNHIDRLDFQLASVTSPLTPRDYRNTWPELTNELLEASYFGKSLNEENGWLAAELKPLLNNVVSETGKAQKIYSYVRDNFTCTDHSALEIEQSLKNVMRTKRGSVSEMNLLLTAMLRYAGLQSDPVILSTTGHGYVIDAYPMTDRFNYVLSKCVADGKIYFLDATHPRLGFGKRLPECYNGHARVVNETADSLNFSADSIKEKKISVLYIRNADGKIVGSMNQTPGYFESYQVRNELNEEGEEAYFKNIEKTYNNGDVKIVSKHIDSLEKYEEPIAIKYEIEFTPHQGEVIYLNPLFGEGLKKNPFESAQRFYPVEMPYTIDEMFLLTMEVPQGYEVDELPKQLLLKLDDTDSGSFEYSISRSGSMISLRSRLIINRTFFGNDEYEMLRRFYSLVVKKQSEPIVFKKKK